MTRGLLPHVLESIHKIYLLSTQHLIVRGSKKQQRRGWDYSNFTKGGTFLVSLKLSAIWGNLTLHHSCLLLPKNTSFLQFCQVENMRGHLFEKIILVAFSPYPHKQTRKRTNNTLLIISGCMKVGPLLRQKNL